MPPRSSAEPLTPSGRGFGDGGRAGGTVRPLALKPPPRSHGRTALCVQPQHTTGGAAPAPAHAHAHASSLPPPGGGKPAGNQSRHPGCATTSGCPRPSGHPGPGEPGTSRHPGRTAGQPGGDRADRLQQQLFRYPSRRWRGAPLPQPWGHRGHPLARHQRRYISRLAARSAQPRPVGQLQAAEGIRWITLLLLREGEDQSARNGAGSGHGAAPHPQGDSQPFNPGNAERDQGPRRQAERNDPDHRSCGLGHHYHPGGAD